MTHRFAARLTVERSLQHIRNLLHRFVKPHLFCAPTSEQDFPRRARQGKTEAAPGLSPSLAGQCLRPTCVSRDKWFPVSVTVHCLKMRVASCLDTAFNSTTRSEVALFSSNLYRSKQLKNSNTSTVLSGSPPTSPTCSARDDVKVRGGDHPHPPGSWSSMLDHPHWPYGAR